ncbi:DUF4442 domain-containing protein [Yinghuangia seranimata]|uniref:DUF4442 domain-containing protein n=1 Tax=Yinghuangia seranimata TaxID=408067 RepID=UPI00248AF66F|nr:DUF4442 domain-containing protein [Yinghuangia seranimata]MDI2129814.1 DUF4442 domain-containing protein [Yinghuangia seranimata]
MTTEFDIVAEGLRQSVPMVRTLGLEFVELSRERAVLRLPDQPDYHNHLAGPHAGAMFTLAESASGAIVIAAFGDLLGRAVPLAVNAEIQYRKFAKGTVLAEARLGRPIEDVVAELDKGERPEFPVAIEIRMEDGTPTAEMTVLWTLKPNRA